MSSSSIKPPSSTDDMCHKLYPWNCSSFCLIHLLRNDSVSFQLNESCSVCLVSTVVSSLKGRQKKVLKNWMFSSLCSFLPCSSLLCCAGGFLPVWSNSWWETLSLPEQEWAPVEGEENGPIKGKKRVDNLPNLCNLYLYIFINLYNKLPKLGNNWTTSWQPGLGTASICSHITCLVQSYFIALWKASIICN